MKVKEYYCRENKCFNPNFVFELLKIYTPFVPCSHKAIILHTLTETAAMREGEDSCTPSCTAKVSANGSLRLPHVNRDLNTLQTARTHINRIPNLVIFLI